MKMRNYTTQVPWSRTVFEIEQLLTKYGATKLMKHYHGDGRIEALFFEINGMAYRLPSNSSRCAELLQKEYPKRKKQAIEEQAERIVWRVIKDWIDAQLSLIHIGQVELQEIFLPYATDGNQTLYQKLKESNYAGLLAVEDKKPNAGGQVAPRRIR